MKTEFAGIINDLKVALIQKERELRNSEDFHARSEGVIDNVNGRIEGLESAGNDIIQNYNGNSEMRINFMKRANEIRKEIESLG